MVTNLNLNDINEIKFNREVAGNLSAEPIMTFEGSRTAGASGSFELSAMPSGISSSPGAQDWKDSV